MSDDDRFSEKNLLQICHSFSSFQKDPTEIISSSFASIDAFVRLNAFVEAGRFLPLPGVGRYSSTYKIDEAGKPSNISVYPTRLWYLPFDNEYKQLGKRHSAAVEDQVRRLGKAYDLIHAHFTWTSGYVGVRLKERYRIPLVVTAHGFDIYSLPFKDPVWKEKIRDVLNAADAIITVSQRNRECVRRLEVDSPVHVIPNGFRSTLFSPKGTTECRSQLGLPADAKILLSVGNLESVKGHRYLVDAIGRMTGHEDNIVCVIVGTGKERRALEKQIGAAGLDRQVALVGSRPHDEIPLWMNACDLFVLPSLDEGNPTVMFEALGCGKPFIGTKVGGVPEIIDSDDYGLLVEPADPDNLADTLLRALDREWHRERILSYGDGFTWEKITGDIIDVYASVSDAI